MNDRENQVTTEDGEDDEDDKEESKRGRAAVRNLFSLDLHATSQGTTAEAQNSGHATRLQLGVGSALTNKGAVEKRRREDR